MPKKLDKCVREVRKKIKQGKIKKTYKCGKRRYSQAKAMERVIMFAKDTPSTRESVIRKMLSAENKLKCRRKK